MSTSEVIQIGADWAEADVVCVLLRGHDQAPEAMSRFGAELDNAKVRYVIRSPECGIWFPKPVTDLFEANAVALNRSLAELAEIVDGLLDRGISLNRVVLGGFEEGACVVAEYLTRHLRGYGGAILLRGGMLDVAVMGRRPGSGLLGVPIYVSGSETAVKIPVERTRGTIRTLQAGGALIRSHVFTHSTPQISHDEMAATQQLLADVLQAVLAPVNC